jgi:N-acetylglucosaminyldiphosphoundecaprenol N-acetyl-beta-D-mannosaminyltransferase
VFLGSPKAEIWIADNLPKLDSLGVRFVIGLGGTADFVAGVTPRAPRFVQWIGLEWLFRLAVAPRQRFRRTLRMFRMPYYALRRR